MDSNKISVGDFNVDSLKEDVVIVLKYGNTNTVSWGSLKDIQRYAFGMEMPIEDVLKERFAELLSVLAEDCVGIFDDHS
jgi:hypothetical protein